MAQDARRRQVPEPEPSALGHRHCRAKARRRDHGRRPEGRDPGDRRFFPDAADRSSVGPTSTWRGGKALTPTIPRATYRDGAARGAQGARSPALGRRHRSAARLAGVAETCNRPSPRRNRRRASSPKSRHLPAHLIEKATRRPARTWEACGRARSRRWPRSIARTLRPTRGGAQDPGRLAQDSAGPLEHDRRRRAAGAGQPLRGAAPGSRHGRRALA